MSLITRQSLPKELENYTHTHLGQWTSALDVLASGNEYFREVHPVVFQDCVTSKISTAGGTFQEEANWEHFKCAKLKLNEISKMTSIGI